MSPSITKIRIAAVVVVAGVSPWLVSLAARTFLGDTSYLRPSLHESLELVGSCIALAVAMLLMIREGGRDQPPHLFWVALALVAMGLIDGALAVAPRGPAWSWLRNTSTLVGGGLFALVWLPPPAGRRTTGVMLVGVLSLGLATAILIWPDRLPVPMLSDGYSVPVKAVSMVGGLGFMAAALFFLQRYRREPETEDLVFASLTLLFATSGMLFGFSHVWAADWWVWHACRLAAYIVVLVAAYHMVVDLRDRAEGLLSESTNRYATLFGNMLNGVAYCRVVYADGRPVDFVYLEVNPAFERLTGLTSVAGRRVTDVIPRIRETNPELFEIYGRVAATGQPEDFETYVEPLGIWLSIAAHSPAREHFVALFENITARKRAEEALRASERTAREHAEEVQKLMDLAPMAIWVALDPECHQITGNRTANAFYEADPGENVSASPGTGQHDTTRRFFQNGRELTPAELPMQVAAATGVDVRNSELEVLSPSGRRFTMLGNASPLRDDDGRVRGCVASFVDITERKLAEAALRESEASGRHDRERLGLAQQAARLGSFEWNIQTGVDRWSKELEAIYGLPPGGFEGTFEDWARRLHPDDVEKAREDVRRSLADGYFESEWRVIWPDGSVHWLYARARVFNDGDGKPLRMVGVNMDVTERRQAEEEVRRLNAELEQRVRWRTAELEDANSELEAFTYSVAHDLRAPLRHIDGFSRILIDEHGAGLSADAARYLSQIRDGSIRMGLLIDDLLSLTRVGRQELHWQMIALDKLAAEVLADLKPQESQRAIEWRIEALPFVECDPGLMKIVLANLFSNALKFTRPRNPTVIEAGATTRDGRDVIFVRDNGVGFSMRYADKLFGVFQRLHRQEDFEGSGVGLATVQRIIHKHGGRVWAEAELDRGATFFFTLGSARGAVTKGGVA